MIPYWCLSLWRWCRQNYPLLFLPKLRQDKTRQDNYTRLKTDWLIDSLFVWLLHSLFDKNDTWAEQSNATIPLWWWPRSLRQDAVLWLREWVTPEDACLLVIVPDAFLWCRPDMRVNICDFIQYNPFPCQSPHPTPNRHKNGPTQNRTGVLRTKISYAAPTPWNLFFLLWPDQDNLWFFLST